MEEIIKMLEEKVINSDCKDIQKLKIKLLDEQSKFRKYCMDIKNKLNESILNNELKDDGVKREINDLTNKKNECLKNMKECTVTLKELIRKKNKNYRLNKMYNACKEILSEKMDTKDENEISITELEITNLENLKVEIDKLQLKIKEAEETIKKQNFMIAKINYEKMINLDTMTDEEIEKLDAKIKKLEKERNKIKNEKEGLKQEIIQKCQQSYPEELYEIYQPTKNKVSAIIQSMNLLMNRTFKDYKSEVLARGASSTVFLVHLIGNENESKILKRISLDSKITEKNIIREIKLLKEMKHPFIINLEGVFIENSDIYLQLPYCEQGNLLHWLHVC